MCIARACRWFLALAYLYSWVYFLFEVAGCSGGVLLVYSSGLVGRLYSGFAFHTCAALRLSGRDAYPGGQRQAEWARPLTYELHQYFLGCGNNFCLLHCDACRTGSICLAWLDSASVQSRAPGFYHRASPSALSRRAAGVHALWRFLRNRAGWWCLLLSQNGRSSELSLKQADDYAYRWLCSGDYSS